MQSILIKMVTKGHTYFILNNGLIVYLILHKESILRSDKNRKNSNYIQDLRDIYLVSQRFSILIKNLNLIFAAILCCWVMK